MENCEVMFNYLYGNLNIILLKFLKIVVDGYNYFLYIVFRIYFFNDFKFDIFICFC